MAVNDITIIGGFIFFFIALGIIVPLIQVEFNQDFSTTDVQGELDKVQKEALTSTSTTVFRVLLSIITMPLWTFGNIPFLLDLILLVPIRIIFWLIIARNVWIGGGG